MSSLRNPFILPFVMCLVLIAGACNQDQERKALISTEYGDITVMLYNSTPKHRDNFIKLVEEGFYDDLLFHRVIDEFMIQGGDPESKNAAPGTRLGMGGPGYEIDAEIGAPHLRGALAAARNNNAAKRSSGSQFYIISGKKQTDDELNYYETTKKIKYNESQRQIYKNEGGYPSLDQEYTVFGEVISGMEVVDKIDAQQVDGAARPVRDIKMKIKMLN